MKILILTILLISPLAFTWDNGLGNKPPMGWNSWNKFHCNINENIIKAAADTLVETGLAQQGYEYVNIDDCWQKSRDSDGKIVEDKEAFPNGIKALADYIHSKGLKFGLYSSAGTKTCEGRPGSLGFEYIDALTYKEWGVDYLKYDNCYNQGISSKERYPKMQDALIKANAKIFYSLCQWGEEDVESWAPPVANSWRTTGDIADNWPSFIDILDKQHGLEKYAGPGAWNDPDMLEVGNGGMTTIESQAHFALWAMLKAPLLIGCDLTNIKKEDLEILSNEEVISVNQDKLGKQASRVFRTETSTGYLDIYAGELKNNTIVVLFHNRSSVAQKMSVKFKDVGFEAEGGAVRDIINHIDFGYVYTEYSADVVSHGVFMFTLHQYCVTDCSKKFLEK